ncbi:hypothetical protein ACQP3J_28330, partial [Escherichia coli]
MMKYHDQKQLREEKIYFVLQLKSITEGSQGTWRQELKQRLKDAAYWLASHGLFSLFSYRTQDHLPR